MLRPILIAGPTASGKTALALALAVRLGGTVINADSQQVFAGWRILSARPTPAEEARAPHRLYGHVTMTTAYSVGTWLAEATNAIAEVRAAGRVPILAGGTGLYFAALTEGLVEIPPVPAEVRRETAARLEHLGLAAFAAELARDDPETAAALDLANPARVLRAREVLDATGTGLAAWQRQTPPPVLPLSEATALRIDLPREALHARIAARLDAMVAAGLLSEVAAVRDLHLDPALPAMKAVGAREFMAHLDGRLTLDDALAAARTSTRRYAKRQLTWARNRMQSWRLLPGPDPVALLQQLETLPSTPDISPHPPARTDSFRETD